MKPKPAWSILRAKHRSEGKCACGRERSPNRKSCPACLASSRNYAARNYKRQVPAKLRLGICITNGCKNEAVPGRVRCDYHLEHNAEKRVKAQKKNKAKGKCSCGKPRSKGYLSCEACRTRRNAYQRLWRQGVRLARRMADDTNARKDKK